MHAQGVKQVVCLSVVVVVIVVVVVVVVVVSTKIARSQDIGFIASDKRCQTVRIIDKTTILCF